MRLDQTLTAAADFNISPDSVIKMRTRYLQSLLAQWVAYIDEKINEIPESDVMAIINELNSYKRYSDNKKTGYKPDITEDMIQQARDYPIEALFDFSRGSRIPCPFHNSKGPDLSLHAKSNTVRCFGSCGKSWNSISAAMELDGVTFKQAVKRLAYANN